jgi:hypothetical protein
MPRLRTLAVATVLALAVLAITRQITPSGGHAPHGAYRAQVDAFLSGRLALSEHPDALLHDLAWTEHGVQQVWGLGVPLWQTPFEVVGRVIGLTPFPDRIPMLAWLALVGYVLARGFRRGGDQREPWFADAGTLVIAALLPAFVALLRGRIGVYEEAAIYAYGAAMILFGGLAGFVRRPSLRGYLVLLAFAGVTGLIRPTVWFYGLGTAIVATAIWMRHERARARALRVVAIGVALFVAGGAVLYATNVRRFGSGGEFGHRLNVHSLPGNIVATRFSYPFERVGVGEAAVELVGATFDRPEKLSKKGFYQEALHRGQSAEPRWREYYFTTFSWPYAPVLALGLVFAVLAWRRRGESDPEARWLGPWALLGLVPLVAFYLWSPSVSSRYQLDLAPGFVALLVIAWRQLALNARATVALATLFVAWGASVATSKTTASRNAGPVDRGAAELAAYRISRPIIHAREPVTSYDLADPLLPLQTDIVPGFERCTDTFGDAITCDAPPMAGDVHLLGERDEVGWIVSRALVPDEDEPVCRIEEPACRLPLAIRDDIVIDRVEVAPPSLYLNGFGWDLTTGRVPPATYVYVEDPTFIELDVATVVPADDAGIDWSRAARVSIAGKQLRLVSLATTGHGARLRFVTDRPLPGVRVAFLAFGDDRDLDQPQSSFTLRRVRWR